MKDALSLIKCKNIVADKVTYSAFDKAQLVCPECFEPVFKKELFVISWQDKTHFFSHYAGRTQECSRRTASENSNESINDGIKKDQALELFNKEFRAQIKSASKKILSSNEYLRKNNQIIEAEKIAQQDICPETLTSLSEVMIDSLSRPINETIDKSLTNLEGYLIPIFNHLLTPYGEKNLRFLTAISIICAYKSKFTNLDTLIEMADSISEKRIKEKLLGLSTILLAYYLGQTKFIHFIEKYLKQYEQADFETDKTLANRPTYNRTTSVIATRNLPESSYHVCPLCGTYTFLSNPKDVFCRVCESNKSKPLAAANYSSLDSTVQSNKDYQINKDVIADRWFYSIPVNTFKENTAPLIRVPKQIETDAVNATKKRWLWNKNDRVLFDYANSTEYSFNLGQVIAIWEASPMGFLVRPDLRQVSNSLIAVDDVAAI
jgi:hypothetical protein